MKKFIKENWFKLIISIALIVFVSSVAYFFAYIPYRKTHDFNKCLSDSANNLLQQQIAINKQIDDLQKQKDTATADANNKLTEFLKNNPEPPQDNSSSLSGIARLNSVFSGKHYQWVQNKNSIFDTVNNLGHQIGDLENKRDNTIQTNKKVDDEACYKRYK